MIHSSKLGELATALALAQGEFESVAKTANNPFFKSKYAALPDVVAAASPILAGHGLAVSQLLGHDEAGDTLTTCLIHKSGEFIADTMHLRPVKNDPQAQGSAVTYGRRYSYMAILGLVADEDDDGNKASAGSKSRTVQPRGKAPGRSAPVEAKPSVSQEPADDDPVSEETLGYLRKAYKDAGATAADLKALLAEGGVAEGTSTDQLTERQATWVALKLQALAKERANA